MRSRDAARKKRTIVFTEEYEIIFRFQSADGSEGSGKKIITIPLVGKALANETNNHDLARSLFREEKPGAQIIRVLYRSWGASYG